MQREPVHPVDPRLQVPPTPEAYTPRIFAQTQFNLTGSSQSMDVTLYRNDGDDPMLIDSIVMLAQGGNTGLHREPAIIVKPTNGPAWSRVPIPMPLMSADNYTVAIMGTNYGAHWLKLQHPYPLGPKDAFDISVAPGAGTGAVGLSLVGYKTKTVPRGPFWAPRFLYSTATKTSAAVINHRFDDEDLRNYEDKPMKLRSMHIAVSSDALSDLTVPGSVAAMRVLLRAAVNGRSWMAQGRLATIGSVRPRWSRQIPCFDSFLPPHAAVQVEAQSLTASGSNTYFGCLISGSVIAS